MSYDLFLTSPKFTREDFQSYFGGRPLYQVSGTQAFYENKDTGAYFVFEFTEPKEEEEEGVPSNAFFNLNYYRPHYFALEAEPEIRKFIETFSFGIHDPQNSGMGSGPYTGDGFLRGWNHGNEFAYSAIIRGGRIDEAIRTLPTARIEDIWRWNYSKKKNQQDLSDEIFVPSIFHLVVNEEVVSMAVWPDAISELIPEVDYVVILREELSSRGEKEHILLPFHRIREILAPYRTTAFSTLAFQLPTPRTPDHIREFVRRLPSESVPATGLPAEKVLNRELVEKARAAGPLRNT